MDLLCQISIFLPYCAANVYVIFEIANKKTDKFGK